jgi:hypothetical protein
VIRPLLLLLLTDKSIAFGLYSRSSAGKSQMTFLPWLLLLLLDDCWDGAAAAAIGTDSGAAAPSTACSSIFKAAAMLAMVT